MHFYIGKCLLLPCEEWSGKGIFKYVIRVISSFDNNYYYTSHKFPM